MFILKMEDEGEILPNSMPGNIEIAKIERNTKILEDLVSVTYET